MGIVDLYHLGSDSRLGSFVGRTLSSIAVSRDGETTLRFTFTEGEPSYLTTEGDCCSESWWADVLGAKSAYGSPITAIVGLNLPDPQDNRGRQAYDSAYGYELRTATGTITLVFRNSSNGYYGGWAEITTPLPAQWQEIVSDDWHA